MGNQRTVTGLNVYKLFYNFSHEAFSVTGASEQLLSQKMIS